MKKLLHSSLFFRSFVNNIMQIKKQSSYIIIIIIILKIILKISFSKILFENKTNYFFRKRIFLRYRFSFSYNICIHKSYSSNMAYSTIIYIYIFFLFAYYNIKIPNKSGNYEIYY